MNSAARIVIGAFMIVAGAAVALKAGALASQIERDRAAGYRLTSFTPYTPQTRAIMIFGCGIGAVVLGVVFLINP
jgi:hypothetical protein